VTGGANVVRKWRFENGPAFMPNKEIASRRIDKVPEWITPTMDEMV